MRILLLGSGGREHALARALARDPMTDCVVSAPGNPGTAEVGRNLDLDPCDGAAVVAAAREHDIDLVVVGPEAPLVAGVADALRTADIPVFGPGAEAARLEGSKAFAKEVMAAADIPTALAQVCTSARELADALDSFGPPYVVKNDGLAAGKGVIVTDNRAAAEAHGLACLAVEDGAVLVEEYLDGPEVSLFCVCDGSEAVALLPAQDFKRALDHNEGPNTGGMGAYSPLAWLPDGFTEDVLARVARPALAELSRRGTPFVGLLYCGLALTSRGVRVVEFNVRFGDPETQAVLELLTSSLPELLYAAATGRLATAPRPRFEDGAAVAVVLAAPGYPGTARTGEPIDGVAEVADAVRHAGTRLQGETLVSAGGRVLAVVGRGADVEQARVEAYDALRHIRLADAHYRRDIAAHTDQIEVPEASGGSRGRDEHPGWSVT
ncbi:MAG: phosphoribosylamine--glycine ligase [Bowdeniella nasicola]|nr:phosphoribosylamine--glycine ligase [Bowdeniella nasicola]